MEVTPGNSLKYDDVRALLDACRYIWRGTRWSKAKQRTVPSCLGGYLVDASGEPLTQGELVADLSEVVALAELTERHEVLLREYFGLDAYPAELSAGPTALVGRIGSPSGRQGSIASRSTVSAEIAEAVRSLIPHLPARKTESPVDIRAARDPVVAGQLAMVVEQVDLAEAILATAYDLTDRSRDAERIHHALQSWAAHWIVRRDGPATGTVKPQAKNAAHAALSVAGVQVLEQKPAVLQGRSWRFAYRPSPRRLMRPTEGRVLITKHGPIDQSDADQDDIVIISGMVDGDTEEASAAADFVIPLLVDPSSDIAADPRELVTWLVVRSLAAQGDWRAVELAMSATFRTRPRLGIGAISFAAHAASMNDHESLAWRLLNHADRMIEAFGSTSPEIASMKRIPMLIRSGICARAADRLADIDPEAGCAELIRSLRIVERSLIALRTKQEAGIGSDLDPLTEQFRLVEIFLVAERYKRLRVALPVTLTEPLDLARKKLAMIRIHANAIYNDSDSDHTIVQSRVEALSIQVETADATSRPLSRVLPAQ